MKKVVIFGKEISRQDAKHTKRKEVIGYQLSVRGIFYYLLTDNRLLITDYLPFSSVLCVLARK